MEFCKDRELQAHRPDRVPSLWAGQNQEKKHTQPLRKSGSHKHQESVYLMGDTEIRDRKEAGGGYPGEQYSSVK